MEVIIRPTAMEAERLVAALIARDLRRKPALVLGLATGRTMEPVYAELARLCNAGKLDFSLCRTFNLDEYVGLEPGHPGSYRYYMNQHLFDRVNIDLRNTHLPDGMADNLVKACRRYEEAIRSCGGIDLQLLGIGEDGHIGFNEPLSALMSRTRDKSLTPATIRQNSGLFPDPAQMPRRALTMGVGTILDANRIVVLVVGAHKAEILAKAVEGPITSMVTGSALQLHAKCTVVVDEAAAARLQGHEYYRWIFENEPFWQKFRRGEPTEEEV